MSKNIISYGRQTISRDDISAVKRVLRSDYLTQGPQVELFERAICCKTGAKYCVVTASATAALHIAVAALDFPADMEGITSPITFVASANCLIYNRLRPVFADIDPRTYCIQASCISRSITDRTRLLIPVHFAGQPADMEKIHEIARGKDLRIIEDAAHAVGSEYPNGKSVGSCCYSDMTVFSFHPVKTITTGEGGAITTNNEDLYEKLLLLRSHGITKKNISVLSSPGPWYYEMRELGFNYRLTDLQAALGISQLKKLEKHKKRRREIVNRYNEAFAELKHLTTPYESPGINSCFHLYILMIDFSGLKKTRKEVMNELSELGIGSQVHYIPVYAQPYYKDHYHFNPEDFPVAEEYYSKSLSIPLYPAMTEKDVKRVISAIRKVCQ
jgi:UDP-4-amino-4,6-dideoxy-N-acetyl-beta-L-altrosamine transaminase